MLASMDRLIDPRAILNFYKEFKDKPPEVAKKKAYEYGIEFGRGLAQQLEIKDNDIEALATIFRLTHRNEPTANIEVSEKKLRVRNEGFCPMMHVASSLNIPWEWLCGNVGWPFFEGLGAAIVPDVELKIIHWRKRGDPHCDHVYEVK